MVGFGRPDEPDDEDTVPDASRVASANPLETLKRFALCVWNRGHSFVNGSCKNCGARIDDPTLLGVVRESIRARGK